MIPTLQEKTESLPKHFWKIEALGILLCVIGLCLLMWVDLRIAIGLTCQWAAMAIWETNQKRRNV